MLLTVLTIYPKRLHLDTTHADHEVSTQAACLGAGAYRTYRCLGIGPASSLSDLFHHNRFTDWGQGDPCQLQVLNTERNTDNAEEAQYCRSNVPQRQPDSGEQEPDDVAQHAKATVTDVGGLIKLLAAYRLLTERKEGELANDKARPAPWDAHDGEEGDETDEPPGQTHNDPAQDEPKKVANCAHCLFPMPVSFRQAVVK